MGARRMRATVVLGNEWPWSGGHVQYLRWAAAANATAGATAAATGGSTGMAAAAAAAPPDPAAACAAAYASAAPPNVSDAVWRSRGHQPGGPAYPGPGQGDWGAYQQAAGGFYADGWAQRAWGAHAAFLTAAVSPYTGVAARDDPTVMAWQLANEPRAGADGAAFAAWLGNASALLKRLAPRQLVSCARAAGGGGGAGGAEGEWGGEEKPRVTS